ncbi:MAG TPA: hypothetical protein VMT66_17205 [Steroidobacteraceae bacterium]|nr:hypothetical protein [Steroidobacteraceae bacterium]
MRTIQLTLVSLLVSAAADAGVVLKVDSKDSTGKVVRSEVYYAQDGMLRVDSVDPKGNLKDSDIVRDGAIWRVDRHSRTFTRVDKDSMQQMMGANSKQMEDLIAQLPPEKRAMMQQRMAQMQQRAGTTQYTFNDTGRSDHSGSYSCRIWTALRDGKPHAEYCVVPWGSLPAGGELEASMRKSLGTVDQILAGVPTLAPQAERMSRLGKLGGFPVHSYTLSASGARENESVLSSAESQALPADKFAIPQGFTEKSLGRGDDEG